MASSRFWEGRIVRFTSTPGTLHLSPDAINIDANHSARHQSMASRKHCRHHQFIHEP
jgi:hypothetical protein